MQNTRTHALSLVTEPNNALNVDRVSHGRLLEECYYIKCEATNQSSHLSTSTSQGRTCPVTRKFGIWGMVTSNANFTFCSYSELNSWLSQNTTCKFPSFHTVFICDAGGICQKFAFFEKGGELAPVSPIRSCEPGFNSGVQFHLNISSG